MFKVITEDGTLVERECFNINNGIAYNIEEETGLDCMIVNVDSHAEFHEKFGHFIVWEA